MENFDFKQLNFHLTQKGWESVTKNDTFILFQFNAQNQLIQYQHEDLRGISVKDKVREMFRSNAHYLMFVYNEEKQVYEPRGDIRDIPEYAPVIGTSEYVANQIQRMNELRARYDIEAEKFAFFLIAVVIFPLLLLFGLKLISLL
jgi:hypothetical protein